MERLLVVAVVAVVAVVVALVVQRRQPDAPVRTGYNVPGQLHRPDFARPDAEWLVVVFTSATCSTCAGVWDKVQVLESAAVATQEVEVSAHRELHDRYRIDGVPTTVVADREGVVRASFLGPATATDLWAALAELREPGSVPEGCDTHVHPDADGTDR
ncbi:MAG: TlpA family protein disulfide reductase [Acidimicrobiia bacterium]